MKGISKIKSYILEEVELEEEEDSQSVQERIKKQRMKKKLKNGNGFKISNGTSSVFVKSALNSGMNLNN